MLKKNILIFFYFTVLFPFVSLFPINTDLQPVFIILTIITAIFYHREISFGNNDLVLIIAGLLSLIYFNLFTPDLSLTKGFSSYVSLFTAMIFLLVFKKTFNLKIFISVFKISIMIYFISSLLFFFMPSFFTNFQSYLVRAINTADEGIGFRGISTYFTEPGLFGAHMVAFLVVLLNLYKKNIISSSSFRLFFLICLSMVLMSKSGMGYAYISVFILLAYWRNKFVIIPLILILFTLSYYNLDSIIEINRGFQSLEELSNLSSSTDNSILKRVYDFSLGIIVFTNNIFGLGVNADFSIVKDIIENNIYFSNYYSLWRPFGFVSSFSFYIVSYGIWFILLILFLLYNYRPSFINFIFFILFISFSFSGSYPIIWMMLIMNYLLKNHHQNLSYS